MNLNLEILQFFVYKKIIDKKDIEEILPECDRLGLPVDRYLISHGYCNDIAATAALGEYYCMPYIEMDMLTVDEALIDTAELAYLKRHKIVPVSIADDGTLVAAVGNPSDFISMSSFASLYPGKVDYVLVPPTQIDVFIDSIAAVRSTASALDNLKREQDRQSPKRVQNGNSASQAESEQDVINAPAVKLVDSVIREAIPFRASDIHVEPFEKIVRIRYRIDGELSDRVSFPIESYPAICARIKIIAEMNIAERRIPQDGHFNMVISGLEYDFRVSSIPTVWGEKFVIRILDKSAFRFTREELGFTEQANAIVDKILAHPHGIVLLTGPTGCGKTTTLYSFLRELNRPDVNVTTVEDPVEYTLEGINQIQVNVKADMTFAAALRSILRQDPDIVMIGEIRDEETAQIAIRAAITGHLVFSTLHTNDAPGAVTRLVDMGVSDYLVADALVGVISQRLVKRLCPACKKKERANAREMAMLGVKEPVSIYRPQGCQYCGGTGYKGRIAVHEIMYMNDALRNAVLEKQNAEQVRRIATENGMVPLFSACREYVLKGITSLQELMSLYMG